MRRSPISVDDRRRALVVDGGQGSSRSALATTRALHAAGIGVIVGTAVEDELAAASRGASEVVRVPAATDATAFRAAITAIETSHAPVATFLTSDHALLAMEVPIAELVDKQRLTERAEEVGIPVPRTRIFATVDELAAAEGLRFPAVVKPQIGSVAARMVHDREEIDRIPDDAGGFAVQPYVDGEMHSVAGVMWEGEMRAIVHQRYLRRWPVDCGTASAAITTPPDETIETGLAELLREHDGIFQAQYIDEYLIDVNPRPYGSMPLALAAGVNLPELVFRLRTGDRPDGVIRAAPGVSYRWLEGDLRHVIHGLRRRDLNVQDAVAALRPRRGSGHSVESLRDPKPMARRLTRVLRKAAGPGGGP